MWFVHVCDIESVHFVQWKGYLASKDVKLNLIISIDIGFDILNAICCILFLLLLDIWFQIFWVSDFLI